MTPNRGEFEALLERGSAELFADHPDKMDTGALRPTPNVIDEGDLELFFEGVRSGLVEIERGARFNTCDRPKAGGRWGLLSRSREGGWYNAEYLPQIAAYVDAILRLGYHRNRVLFELPASALQLDVAILDDRGDVAVLGEAKREVGMLDQLVDRLVSRFGDAAPTDESKKRGDEARQLAWRLWAVRPKFLWLIGPGVRRAYACSFAPVRLELVGPLPSAVELSLDGAVPELLAPPDLRATGGSQP